MRKRKFSRGMQVWSLDQVWGLIHSGGWIWIRHKAYHPGWIMSRTIRSLQSDIDRGHVFMAVRSD